MNKAFKHFFIIARHKWEVFKCCFLAGIPIRGLLHDLSKYTPVEFFESIKYYTGTSSPIDGAKKDMGYSAAWQHHKGHNPHHYEYWIDKLDDGGVPLIIPYKYAVEMACDYVGAGKVYSKEKWTQETPYVYWMNKKKTAKIHPQMVLFFDQIFLDIKLDGLKIGLSRDNTMYRYFITSRPNIHRDY